MASKLKEAREKAGYTIEEVAEALKIRKQYIINLEEENFRAIPGQVYVEGYTKIYSEFLKLDSGEDSAATIRRPKAKVVVRKVNRNYVVFFSACMVVVAVLVYVKLIPMLTESIEEDSIVTKPEITENIIDNYGNNETTFD